MTTIVMTPLAEDQLQEVGEWWRAHREASPLLVADELDRCLTLLESSPDVGARFHRSHIRLGNPIALSSGFDTPRQCQHQRELVLQRRKSGAPLSELPGNTNTNAYCEVLALLSRIRRAA
jgi:hypothetical protein